MTDKGSQAEVLKALRALSLAPRPLLVLALLPSLALFAAALSLPALRPIGYILDALVLLWAGIDAAAALFLKPPVLRGPERGTLPSERAFPLGRPVSLELEAELERPSLLWLRLDFPDEFGERGEPSPRRLRAGEGGAFSFTFRATRRGSFAFPRAHWRIASPLGLFWKQGSAESSLRVKIIPDLSGLRERLKAARSGRSLESGQHPSLRRGGESELDYLREYRLDDEIRRIDWKASCRLGRPVTKVLRSETSRNVAFLLDRGRLMTAEQGGLSALDHAVGAVIMLSRVALEMGDSVSLSLFSDKIDAELAPVRGKEGLRRVASLLAEAEPVFAESNYAQAFEVAERRLRKRSLVVMISDMADEMNVALFSRHFAALRRRHLPLLVLLRDSQLEAWRVADIERGEDGFCEYSRTAARQMAASRARAVELLRARGLHVLDILPAKLSASLADAYLELKSRGRI